MAEMIERVARAVWPELFSDETEAECDDNPAARRRLRREQSRAREDARVAIKAMQEPTEAMVNAAVYSGHDRFRHNWRTAILVALQESK
jgi:hypothetical protein